MKAKKILFPAAAQNRALFTRRTDLPARVISIFSYWEEVSGSLHLKPKIVLLP